MEFTFSSSLYRSIWRERMFHGPVLLLQPCWELNLGPLCDLRSFTDWAIETFPTIMLSMSYLLLRDKSMCVDLLHNDSVYVSNFREVHAHKGACIIIHRASIFSRLKTKFVLHVTSDHFLAQSPNKGSQIHSVFGFLTSDLFLAQSPHKGSQIHSVFGFLC